VSLPQAKRTEPDEVLPFDSETCSRALRRHWLDTVDGIAKNSTCIWCRRATRGTPFC